MTQPPTNSPQGSTGTPWSLWTDAASYWVDAWQRSILYLDVLRQRGNQYHEHMAEQAPHVLQLPGCELVLDGRDAAAAGELRPGPDHAAAPASRSIRRSGRSWSSTRAPATGPGSAASRPTARSAWRMRAGHPCYFVGLPARSGARPDRSRTSCAAEAAFLERVIELHPEAEGKPVVIGNCQAGWQMMMAAATRPELFGPIIVAGAPLSYWAGVRGANPMRYSGGLHRRQLAHRADRRPRPRHLRRRLAWSHNFESLNPANTLWTKQYNLYANIDTEAARYLGFEQLVGRPCPAQRRGDAVDRRQPVRRQQAGHGRDRDRATACASTCATSARRSSCFCSKGDDITPPQQALGWITDLYGERRGHPRPRPDHRLLRARERRPSRHLRLRRRGQEGARGVRLQHRLHRRACRPGLYEAVLTAREAGERRTPTSWSATMSLRFEARDARRHPGPGRQRASRTSAASPPWRGCRRSISASTAP